MKNNKAINMCLGQKLITTHRPGSVSSQNDDSDSVAHSAMTLDPRWVAATRPLTSYTSTVEFADGTSRLLLTALYLTPCLPGFLSHKHFWSSGSKFKFMKRSTCNRPLLFSIYLLSLLKQVVSSHNWARHNSTNSMARRRQSSCLDVLAKMHKDG